MGIASLGYIGLHAGNLAAWSTFAEQVLGVMPVDGPPGPRRFRIDDYAWRIAIEPGPDEDIAYVGFEVPDAEALATLEAHLIDLGIAVSRGDADRCALRGVCGLLETNDPTGLAVELFYGPTYATETPLASPAGVSGFLTENQGLGHVVLTSVDMDSSRRFYTEALGLRLSDTILLQLAPDVRVELEFYHCNARHHTLALAPAPPGAKRLHHFMLQVRTLDDVGFALDRALRAGTPITQGLGRHTNDRMVSFYARTPSGVEVEYGFDALEVDRGSWRVARHNRISSWGHHRPE